MEAQDHGSVTLVGTGWQTTRLPEFFSLAVLVLEKEVSRYSLTVIQDFPTIGFTNEENKGHDQKIFRGI